MAREVWVVERKTIKESAYVVDATYTIQHQATNAKKRFARDYPNIKWRVVRYVPEDEK